MSIVLAITLITLAVAHLIFQLSFARKKRRLPKLVKIEPRSRPFNRIMADQNSTLLSLPSEVLGFIVSCLDTDGIFQTRATCSLLKEFADPILFSSFEIDHGQDAEQLAILIQADPRRAKWLRSMLVSTRFDEDAGLHVFPQYLTMMENMRRLVLETPDCNSKVPSYRVSWIQLQQQYEMIFRHSSLAVPREERLLPMLEECTLHFVDETVSLYPLTKYESIFIHPTLKSLTVSCACTDKPEQILARYRQFRGMTALTHLHLEECDFHPQSLQILLKFPRALKRLVISEGTRYNDTFGIKNSRMHGDVSPNQLSHALTSSVGHSLEQLSLSLGHVRRATLTEARGLHLSGLTMLKDLDISFVSWRLIASMSTCNHNWTSRLPPSLQTIRVFQIPIFKIRGHHALLFKQCLFQDKVGHGLPNLSAVKYSYVYATPTDRIAGFAAFPHGLQDETVMKRLIDHSLARIKATQNRRYPMYAATGIRVIVECEMTPPGYIPPYLNNEEKPEYRTVWDSAAPPLEALQLVHKHAEQLKDGGPPIDYDQHAHVDTGFSWIATAIGHAQANAPGLFELLIIQSGQPIVDALQ